MRKSIRQAIARLLALSLAFVVVLMPARLLASELLPAHAAMAPCHMPQACHDCDLGSKKTTACGDFCAATCSQVLLRLPRQPSQSLRFVLAVLQPAAEVQLVSLSPDPPKRPPRSA